MTREQALHVDRLLVRIEHHEALVDEIKNLPSLADIEELGFDLDLRDKLVKVVVDNLDQLLSELAAI